MKRPSAPPAPSRLTRDQWLDAAFAAVVEGGFDQVRVLLLAQRLGVTRGSFYWHFSDHAELIAALLQRWSEREQALDASLLAHHTDDARADLEHLLDAALAYGGKDLENIRFGLALRSLGQKNPEVAQMVLEIDASRMNLFEKKFMRLTGDPVKSADLAILFYLSLAGCFQALSRPLNGPHVRERLKGIVSRYLIDEFTPPAFPPRAGKAPAARRRKP